MNYKQQISLLTNIGTSFVLLYFGYKYTVFNGKCLSIGCVIADSC